MKHYVVHKFFSLIASLGFFILLNSPSIKLIYPSALINITGPLLILIVFFLRFKSLQEIVKNKHNYFISFGLIVTIILIYFALFKESKIDFTTFFRYMYWVFVLLLTVATSSFINTRLVILFIQFWALLLALMNIFGLLNPDRDLGQHYLTVGLPIGAGLSVIMVKFIYSKNKSIIQMLINMLFVITLIYSLLLSRGRSNIIFPFLTIFSLLILRALYGKNKIKYIGMITMVIISLMIAYNYLIENTLKEFPLLGRMSVLFNDESSSLRMTYWKRAINLFLDNLLGHGVESHQKLFGIYPHNIFIESVFSFGLIGIIFLLIFSMNFFNHLKSLKTQTVNVYKAGLAALSIYFFFIWNTSFDLATSYIPLCSMLLFNIKINNAINSY